MRVNLPESCGASRRYWAKAACSAAQPPMESIRKVRLLSVPVLDAVALLPAGAEGFSSAVAGSTWSESTATTSYPGASSSVR
ncbi:unnamed protein product, partial [Clonostachys rhizophaga]